MQQDRIGIREVSDLTVTAGYLKLSLEGEGVANSAWYR